MADYGFWPSTVSQQMQISLYTVSEDSYTSLRLIDSNYPHWIVSHVLSGEVETITAGHRLTVQAGDVMIHPPHVPFSEWSDGSGTHQWLGLDIAMSPKLDLFRFYPVSLVVKMQSPDAFSSLFGQLREMWVRTVPTSRDFCCASYATALMAMLLESWHAAGSPPRPLIPGTNQERFNEIIQYMTGHMSEKLTRAQLADMLHLHPVYLDRAFVECFGITPIQLLRELRLKRAKQILETSAETLTSIAEACGFNDAAHFSRLFSSRYGQTPGEYREQAKLARRVYIG